MSIHDVAKRAKVSIATVSRTLHNNPRVNPDTAARVWQAIHDLKYYPNTHARSLASGRSHLVGLIVSDITNPFFPELVRGFEELASARGYDTIIASTNYQPARIATAVRRMIERKVDGVGIMTSEMDQNLVDEMANRDVPMVFLDVASPARRISNLRIDYVGGVNLAVRHLLELGHRRIGFLGGPSELKSARTRHDAFLECLQNFGIIEDERRGLVDRRRPRAGCRVGLRAGVDGKRCKSGIAVGHLLSCLPDRRSLLAAMLMGSRAAVKARRGTSPTSE